MKILFAGTFAFVNLFLSLPAVDLLVAMGIAIAFDFFTGCYKSRRRGEVLGSEGFRRTVDKFVQYGFGVAASSVLAFISKKSGGNGVQALTGFLNDGLVCFIIYIEMVSIFENLAALNPEGPMSKNFFEPIRKILTLQIKNNPLKRQVDTMEATDSASQSTK